MYCVFKAYGDSDDFVCYDLLGVYSNFDKCIDDVMTLSVPINIDIIHHDMDIENNYTVISERSKCLGDCKYGYFGGYIIEKIPLNKLTK